MQTDVLDKLIYVDAMAENAKTKTKMQGVMDLVSQACDNYNLTISTKNTEVVYQPSPGKPYNKQKNHCDKDCNLMINSPIWKALSPEQCTLIMRLLSGMESDLTLR